MEWQFLLSFLILHDSDIPSAPLVENDQIEHQTILIQNTGIEARSFPFMLMKCFPRVSAFATSCRPRSR